MEMKCVFGHEYMKDSEHYAIIASKNGKYINLTKKGDKNKEFRYNIQEGTFERINHYKKGDKITPVRVKNITRWFTDCSIFCDDEKFAKVMIANKYHYRNQYYSSGVRFIEALNSTFAKNYEAWLSLNVTIKDIEKSVNRCIEQDRMYSFRPTFHTSLYVHPSHLDKRLLRFIINNYDEITTDQISALSNIPELDILLDLNELSKDIKYREIFEYKWDTYSYVGYHREREVHEANLFELNNNLDYTGNRIRNGIIRSIDNYNLNLNSFLDFIRRAYYVEGLTLEDLFGSGHYPDYLKMEKVMKKNRMSKIEKYPRQFLTQFHILTREYNAFKEEHDNEVFKNQCDMHRDLEKKYKKYQIIVPDKISDIEYEADNMHHCVRTYISKVIDGKTLIVFLRTNENPEEPLVTIEVKDGFVTQAYGKYDHKPENEELDAIRKWAEEKHLALSWVWDR